MDDWVLPLMEVLYWNWNWEIFLSYAFESECKNNTEIENIWIEKIKEKAKELWCEEPLKFDIQERLNPVKIGYTYIIYTITKKMQTDPIKIDHPH